MYEIELSREVGCVVKETRKADKQQAQEQALLHKEQGLTYRQVAEEMSITEGSAQYLVRCARRRMAESLVLAERLRVHPGWEVDEFRIDVDGVGESWFYWPNIPGEVVWHNAYGSQITATEGGYLVEAPYVEYSTDAMNPFYRLKPGQEAPVRHERRYSSDAALIEDLPLIERWNHPVKP